MAGRKPSEKLLALFCFIAKLTSTLTVSSSKYAELADKDKAATGGVDTDETVTGITIIMYALNIRMPANTTTPTNTPAEGSI